MDVGKEGQRGNLRLESKVGRMIHELDNWQLEIVRRRQKVRWVASDQYVEMLSCNIQRMIGGGFAMSLIA